MKYVIPEMEIIEFGKVDTIIESGTIDNQDPTKEPDIDMGFN